MDAREIFNVVALAIGVVALIVIVVGVVGSAIAAYRSEGLPPIERIAWLTFIVLAPVIGTLAWLAYCGIQPSAGRATPPFATRLRGKGGR